MSEIGSDYSMYRIETKPNKTTVFADKGRIVECPKGTVVFTHSKGIGCIDCEQRVKDAPFEGEDVIHCHLAAKENTQKVIDEAKNRAADFNSGETIAS